MRLLEEAAFTLQKSPAKPLLSRYSGLGMRNGTYTERFLSSLIALISIFLLPMADVPRACRVFDSTPLCGMVMKLCWIATVS
jgi:hypothetical protein